MQPLSPLQKPRDTEPNLELLRRSGWSVSSFAGPYCMAWRGRNEVVFQWREGEWHRVGGHGGVDDA